MKDQMVFMSSGTWMEGGKRFEGSLILAVKDAQKRLIDIKSPVLYE
jgi:hypothetical protein